MAEDLVVAGSKNLHTWSKTIGASLVADEFVLLGENPYATYTVWGGGVTTTANAHQLQLMAGSSLNVRLKRIRIYQNIAATTTAFYQFDIWRLSTAGTGGVAVTPRPFDTTSSASGATAQSLPTAKGTESVQLDSLVLIMTSTAAAGQGSWEWAQLPNSQPIMIPAGTSNGIAIKNVTSAAAGSVRCLIEFQETAF